jgi:hypothetical protein
MWCQNNIWVRVETIVDQNICVLFVWLWRKGKQGEGKEDKWLGMKSMR